MIGAAEVDIEGGITVTTEDTEEEGAEGVENMMEGEGVEVVCRIRGMIEAEMTEGRGEELHRGMRRGGRGREVLAEAERLRGILLSLR